MRGTMMLLTGTIGLTLIMGCSSNPVANNTLPGDGSPTGDTVGGDQDMPLAGELAATITRPRGTGSFLTGETITFAAAFTIHGLQLQPESIAWTSSLDGDLGATNPLDVTLSVGEHEVTVSGTMGADSAQASITVTVSDFAVRILDPRDGDIEDLGDPIAFAGVAQVDEGGGVVTTLVDGAPGGGERPATFAWSSSLDGAFGGGQQQFNLATLSQGNHTITLTVTDDQAGGTSGSGTASIALEVAPPNTAPTVSITEPATCPVDLEQGTALTLAGTVTDPDPADSALAGSWHDSLSGERVEGNDYTLPATAALGKHQLVFSAADNRGAVDSVTCNVYVFPAGGSHDDLFPDTTALNDLIDVLTGQNDASWIGSDGGGITLVGADGGLLVLDSASDGTFYDGDSLDVGEAQAQVEAVAVDGDRVYVATDVGLAACDYAMGSLSDCVEIRDGDIQHVATANGLIAAGVDGGLWLASEAGGVIGDEHTFTEGNTNLPSNDVQDALFVGDTLYVATDAGLCIAQDPAAALAAPDTVDLCSQTLDSDNSLLPDDDIRALAHADGVLWIGTDDGLVAYYPATGAMIIYNTAAGLANNSVNDVVVDEAGVVWVATDNGVSRLDPATGGITNLMGQDLGGGGGGGNRVQGIFIDGDGTKWFATDNGVAAYSGS